LPRLARAAEECLAETAQFRTLRGADLSAAEDWRDRPADANASADLHQQSPGARMHQDFARAGRLRYWVGASLLVAVVAIALAAFAEINRRGVQEPRGAAETARNEAQRRQDRVERTITLMILNANSHVFDLAQKSRDAPGRSASTINDILGRARLLQDMLLEAGESSPGLRRSQAAALTETANALLELGETQGALMAAKRAQETLQALLERSPRRLGQVRVNCRRGDVDVPKQNLHDPRIHAAFQKPRRIAVAERMGRDMSCNAGSSSGLPDRIPQHLAVDRCITAAVAWRPRDATAGRWRPRRSGDRRRVAAPGASCDI
jgi:hypothetical protein